MDQEKEALIKKLTLEGKDKADVRRSLISLGFSTEGFDAVYDALRKDVPKKADLPQKTAQEALKGTIVGDYESFQEHVARKETLRKKRGPSVFSILTLVMCCGVAYMLSAQYLSVPHISMTQSHSSETSESGVSFDPVDALIKVKVDTTASSAEYFESRIGTFSEVCKEVVIVEPTVCLETDKGYVVYAPLSDGNYYCVDSSRFKGVVSTVPLPGESCK